MAEPGRPDKEGKARGVVGAGVRARRRWADALAVYGDRRVLSLFFFGFASGLPFLLVYSTLSAWLTEAGISRTEIGLVSLVGIAYALKFLWAPLVDQMPLPLLTARFGRRRAWMLASQFCLLAATLGMAGADPARDGGLQALIGWALVVAFASATQDVAVDAYRTEILADERLGAGAATLVFGYRIGLLVAGGGALVVAELAGWFWAYATMAGLVLVGVAAVLLNPEPAVDDAPPSARPETGSKTARSRGAAAAAWLNRAVWSPFREFLGRPGWLAILVFVAFYKYGDALLGVMANPFYLDIGFSKSEIGLISKGWGFAATLVGAALGGVLVARYGIVRALIIGGVLQAASNLVFAVQAYVGYSVPMLIATIGIENLTGGIGTTAFVAYLSGLCNVAYTATQYALLSSLMAAARTVLASGGGWLSDHVGWVVYFLITTAAALPGLVLLLWMARRYPAPEPRRAGDGGVEP